MIIIIFLSLAVVYFLIQHFEKRRNARNEEQHQRRRDAFQNLLDTLKEKDNKKDTE